ncbi:MAG: DUF4386 domain-containing protein [Actinomycetes bacterium]
MPGQHETVSPPGAEGSASLTGRTYTRLIGGLFLAGFVTYGAGFALVSSVVDTPELLSRVSAHQTTLVLGAFLMLLNTAVDIGKAVLFFPILEKHGRRTALTYLSAMVFEVALLAVGALCLLALVPLAGQVDAGQVNADLAQSLGSLAVDSNAMAYQIGQAGLAFGAFFLCVLLYRTRLVPRFLAMWGMVGYVVHFTGAVAEIFGSHVSLVLLIPGGLFELTFGVWLLIKGVRIEQHSQGS